VDDVPNGLSAAPPQENKLTELGHKRIKRSGQYAAVPASTVKMSHSALVTYLFPVILAINNAPLRSEACSLQVFDAV
jgi:hypothetical protein